MQRYGTFAAVDIGSNAVRILIKRYEFLEGGKTVESKLCFLRYPLRLGEDVFTTGCISELKQGKLCSILRMFREMLRLWDIDRYRVCATSAMRDAKNRNPVLTSVLEDSNISIEVLSGEEEASLLHGSKLEKVIEECGSIAHLDVGGGSSELTVVEDGKIVLEKSYRIGTIRMLHNLEEENRKVLMEMEEDIDRTVKGPIDLCGSGGNIRKAGKILSVDKENSKIDVKELKDLFKKLRPMSVAKRRLKYDMKADRAEVIVPALEIFLTAAKALKSETITAPPDGLVDGIIKQL